MLNENCDLQEVTSKDNEISDLTRKSKPHKEAIINNKTTLLIFLKRKRTAICLFFCY